MRPGHASGPGRNGASSDAGPTALSGAQAREPGRSAVARDGLVDLGSALQRLTGRCPSRGARCRHCNARHRVRTSPEPDACASLLAITMPLPANPLPVSLRREASKKRDFPDGKNVSCVKRERHSDDANAIARRIKSRAPVEARESSAARGRRFALLRAQVFDGDVAADAMAGARVVERRFLLFADVAKFARAARVEDAA